MLASNINRMFPATQANPVTPSDTGKFAPSRGIYVGASGNLRVMTAHGDIVTFTDISAGLVHPLQVVRVYSTGTTATGIIILR